MSDTEKHLTNEESALLDSFLMQTDDLETVNSDSENRKKISMLSLLELLRQAQDLIALLQLKAEPTGQADIVTRITHLEEELSELKDLVSKRSMS